jgi:hypothetical protein
VRLTARVSETLYARPVADLLATVTRCFSRGAVRFRRSEWVAVYPFWKTRKTTKGMKDVERGNADVSKMVDDEKSVDEEAGAVEVKGV